MAVFCGKYTNEQGKEKMVNVILEPPKPMCHSMYWCDSHFHTEHLKEQLEAHQRYGFVLIDGNGASFHTLAGSQKLTLHKFDVALPKKHGRGGQSKQRFERLRAEKRDWYVKKVAALCVQYFIDQSTNKPNVSGIILAGHADFKLVLSKSSALDPRLRQIIVRQLDIQYGGEAGFNETIRLAEDILSGLKHVQERKLLGNFFTDVANDSAVCYGVEDTCFAIETGTLEKLVLWDSLPARRYTLKSKIDQSTLVCYTPDKETLPKQVADETSNWEIVKQESLLEWLLDHFEELRCSLELVTDQSNEGSQFINGFGGIGGFLRYRVPLPSSTLFDEEEECEFEY